MMSVKYTKLDGILQARGKKLSDLRGILPTATVARLRKNEYISMESMEKICIFLNCQPGDIMEVYKEVTYIDEDGNEQKKRSTHRQRDKGTVSRIVGKSYV